MNLYRNFLAYLRNQCYVLPKFNYVIVLKMSAFGRLRQGFAGAAALATASFAASPALAQNAPTGTLEMRESAFCGELYVDPETNNERNARYTAWRYGRDNPGVVGISIFAGRDFAEGEAEQFGAAVVNAFRRRGVQAECFIDSERVPNGSGIRFHVGGLTIPAEGPSYSISDVYNPDDPRVINDVAAEAQTARIMLASADDLTNRP